MPFRIVRLAARLAMVVFMVFLVGCGPQASAPTVVSTAAAKTPKPTFTPVTPAPGLAPTATVALSQPTAAPTATVPPSPATQIPSQQPATIAPTQAAPTETPLPTPKSLRLASPEYGMQAFMWWRPEVASRDVQVIREAGFGWIKVNFGWREIEGAAKGHFDWSHTDKIVEMATAEKMALMVRIDHQPAWAGGGFPTNGPPDNLQHLGDFLRALAGRYKGQIRAYEVWNEPNLAREWGGQVPDPGAYVKMLRVAYSAIKAADPSAMVISAGLSPTGTWNAEARPDEWYLESMYIAMGGSGNGHFDVLGVHAPGFKVAPETDPAAVAADPNLGGQRAFAFRHVEDLRAIMVKYGDANKQIAVLEFGWTSDPRPDSPYTWHAVSEQTKADYLVRAYQYAKKNWAPWIGLMSLIYVCDPDWTQNDEQYWWAISDPGWPEFKPRPAYSALKAMPK
jgi:hypothetical protein